MKNMLIMALTVLTVLPVTSSAEKLSDYLPGHLPDTKNVRFSLEDGVLSMKFGTGNGYKSQAWMRRYYPFIKPGEKLHLSIMTKTTGIDDPRAKVGFMVQALGPNKSYLASRNYSKFYPASDFSNAWKPMEFIFTMPDPAKTFKWDQGEILLIVFIAQTMEGLVEFKDYKAEKVIEQ